MAHFIKFIEPFKGIQLLTRVPSKSIINAFPTLFYILYLELFVNIYKLPSKMAYNVLAVYDGLGRL